MLFKSPIFSQASGSIAGATFSRNRGGMYTRARAIPTNPNTTKQANIRSYLTSMVTYWTTTLTAVQRLGWEVYASNVTVLNRLGDAVHLTGQQMFLRTNVLGQQVGATVVADAPTTYNTGNPIAGITSFTIAGGVATIVLAVMAPGTSGAGKKILQVGFPQNAARNFFKGPYQNAYSAAVIAASTAPTMVITLASAWLASYTPTTGQYIPCRLRVLYTDGRLSLPYSKIQLTA